MKLLMKFQVLLKKQTQKTYLKIFVNKSEIRKKIFKIRKQSNFQNLEINFEYLLNILKKAKISSKVIGGYYPYNYEINVIKILEKFEKKNTKFRCQK